MNKYALLFYGDEGVYYYIPLLGKDATLDDAKNAALEYIARGETFCDDGDLSFEIAEIASVNEYTTADYQPFFEKKTKEARKHRKEEQDRADKVRYEELKKRFDA